MNADTITWDGTRCILEGINPAIDHLVAELRSVASDVEGFNRVQEARCRFYKVALSEILIADFPKYRTGHYCLTTDGDAVFFSTVIETFVLTKQCAPYSNYRCWRGDMWNLYPVGIRIKPNGFEFPQPAIDPLHLAAIRIEFDKARKRRAALEGGQ